MCIEHGKIIGAEEIFIPDFNGISEFFWKIVQKVIELFKEGVIVERLSRKRRKLEYKRSGFGKYFGFSIRTKNFFYE